MGMRVGGNNASWASQGAGVNNWQQRQQGMKDLMSTLASGDLAGAQKVYASFAGNKGQIDSNSPLGKIGSALQNNDLAGAEKIAQAIQASRNTAAVKAQAITQSSQTSSVLSMIRGQGGQVNLMA
jgi:hypothetical protein